MEEEEDNTILIAQFAITKDDIKRYAKEEYLPGYYFVSYKDIRGTLPMSTYEEMKA